MPTQAPGRVIGRYLLFGEIASGGMATVHFGRLSGPAGFARTVAVKRLHPHYAREAEFVTMFLDEARLAARVRHPNVVPTLDVVSTDGEIFLVMEYVQGESLARLLRSVRSLMTPADARIVATIMGGVLHGLHAAHEARSEQGEALHIVHRDVSPQNILVGVDGAPRVLDFGVAKAVGRLQTTREGQIKGKLAYMAPEQLHGATVTRQTDVYAAAVVTWEALTGQRLFRGDNEAAVVTAVLQATLQAPSQAAAHVPLAFDRVVMRGLEREPSRRYATARDMALDLERCVGVASAAEVGEWVEGLARDELRKRAAHIAEIESVSSPVGRIPTLPAIAEMPTTLTGASTPVPAPAQEVRSDVSSIAVSPIISSPPRRPRGRFAIAASVGGAVALGALCALLVFGGGGSSGPSAASTGATAAASVVPAPDPAPPPPEATTDPPAATAAAVLPSPPADTTTSTPLPTHRRVVSAPVPPAAPRKPADCDPPFTIDDKGHKHYKPACLQ